MSPDVLGSYPSHDDELGDGRTERAREPRQRLRLPDGLSSTLRNRGMVALAFVLGLGLGGAGWGEWLERRDAAAAHSVVSMSARLASARATPRDIPVSVIVTNSGPEPIQIDDLEFHGTGVLSSFRPDRAPIEVPSGREVTSRLVLRMTCTATEDVEPMLTVRVQTADRASRSSELPLADDGNQLGKATSSLCPDPNQNSLPLTVVFSDASSVVEDGRPALRMPVRVATVDFLSVTVTGVRTATPELSVTVTGVPFELNRDVTPEQTLTLTWRVENCGAQNLRAEDLNLVFEAQRPRGDVISVPVATDANVALGVARFVAETCRVA